MLKLNNVSLRLKGSNKIGDRLIIDNLSMNIAEGEFVVIIGSNGAGKSTLLNLITGMVEVSSGNIILDNKDFTNVPLEKRVADIAKVMQDPRLGTMELMTIYENLSLAYNRGNRRTLAYFDNKSRRKFFKQKLSSLNMGLENRLDDLVIDLSGGQRQALSLIMAIMHSAKLLLLDEITAALDPNSAHNVMLIANKIIQEEKRSTIMITHNMKHALEYGDRILLLDRGKIFKEYTKEEKSKIDVNQLTLEFVNL